MDHVLAMLLCYDTFHNIISWAKVSNFETFAHDFCDAFGTNPMLTNGRKPTTNVYGSV